MKFYCCGIVYSTHDPETYWCIETYHLKKPLDDIIGGKRIYKQIVYALCCKIHGCLKLELHSYGKENGKLKLLYTQSIKGQGAITFLERTKKMRIKQPQCCPLKTYQYSKKIPWVYGKTVNSTTQVVRYFDESGNRQVFKGQMPDGKKFEPEYIKSEIIRKEI